MTGTRARRLLLAVGAVVVLAMLLASHRFGRAEPTGAYRPELPPDGLAEGCYPLPGDARLDLPYNLRSDGDVATDHGRRRLLVGHFHRLDPQVAEDRLVEAFEAVGFELVGRPVAERWLLLEDARGREVRVRVRGFRGADDGDLVRGQFELELPVTERASDDPDCDRVSVTKRWSEWEGEDG